MSRDRARPKPLAAVIRDNAACADHDPELFFDQATIAAATAVCQECPVKAACLAYARQARLQEGVWGGQPMLPDLRPHRHRRRAS